MNHQLYRKGKRKVQYMQNSKMKRLAVVQEEYAGMGEGILAPHGSGGAVTLGSLTKHSSIVP